MISCCSLSLSRRSSWAFDAISSDWLTSVSSWLFPFVLLLDMEDRLLLCVVVRFAWSYLYGIAADFPLNIFIWNCRKRPLWLASALPYFLERLDYIFMLVVYDCCGCCCCATLAAAALRLFSPFWLWGLQPSLVRRVWLLRCTWAIIVPFSMRVFAL